MVTLIQNREELNTKIEEAGEKLIVLDFFANWCGPCKIISPTFEQLATKYAEEAVMIKIDVDDCEEIAIEYKVTSMPTFIFIKNKEVIYIFVGSNTDKLIKTVEKYVSGEKILDSSQPSMAAVSISSDDIETPIEITSNFESLDIEQNNI